MNIVKFKRKSEDPVWKQMNEEVHAYFSSNNISEKANTLMFVKAAFYVLVTASLYIAIVFFHLPVVILLFLTILLGIAIAGIGFNISHDALHGAFSSKRSVNALLGYSMDLVGPNGYMWKLNHNIHHATTNIHGLDGDIKDSKFLRLCPYAPYHRFHRYQVFTSIIIYSSFYLLIVYVFNFFNVMGKRFGNHQEHKHPSRQVVWFFLQKLLYIAIWIFVPFYFMDLPVGIFIAGYLLLGMVIGVLLSLLFFIAHDVDIVDFEKEEEITKPVSWAELHLKTTANFRTGKLLGYYLGGLNYQVEHHLFPGISSIHYPRISPIVKRVAEQHGLHYHMQENVFQSLRSHFKFLYKLSKPDLPQGGNMTQPIAG